MPSVVDLVSYAGYVVLLITVIESVRAAWRQRDSQHLSVVFVVSALAASLLLKKGQPGSTWWFFHTALVVIQPYLAVRLVQQFRDVPVVVERGAIGVAIAALIALLAWPVDRPPGVDVAVAVCIVGIQAYAATGFTREARRTAGVTRRRLVFAAFGSWAFGFIFLLLGVGQSGPSLVKWEIAPMLSLLSSTIFFCYYFAFATPQWLKREWREAEHARFLSNTANRDAEARGEHAADDLNEAVGRSVSNVATLVALPADGGSSELVVWASSDPSLVGAPIVPEAGVIGQAFRTGAVASTVTECEPAIADRLRPRGSRVLVAPIATEGRTWGVVLAVQRRGSLFPEDDLHLVAQLARYTATALEHAALVLESRQRERDEAARQVRVTEERMAELLGSVKDYALYVLDERGSVSTWHSGAEHVFGRAPSDVKGGSASSLFALTESEFQAHLETARDQGHVEFECRCVRRDGSRFTGVTVLRPLDLRTSDVRGFAGVTRDVTDRQALEARLRHSQKLEAVGQLAGGVAHDFNNLLAIIVGNVDVLKARLPHDLSLVDELGEIVKAAENASSLTKQLLTFSQRQTMPPAQIRLAELLAGLAPMLRRTLGANVQVITELPEDLAPIAAVPGQVESMLLNLALNARDAMPDGGLLTIRASNVHLPTPKTGLDAGSYVTLEVVDTGIGMDETTRSRIFEPFFTTKGLGRGTGLGLATLYGAVHQLGGTVQVESEPARGTTFRLYFPSVRA